MFVIWFLYVLEKYYLDCHRISHCYESLRNIRKLWKFPWVEKTNNWDDRITVWLVKNNETCFFYNEIVKRGTFLWWKSFLYQYNLVISSFIIIWHQEWFENMDISSLFFYKTWIFPLLLIMFCDGKHMLKWGTRGNHFVILFNLKDYTKTSCTYFLK